MKAVDVTPLKKRLSARPLEMCGDIGLMVYTYVELEVRIAVETASGLVHSEVLSNDEPDEWIETVHRLIDRNMLATFANKAREGDEDS